MTRPTEEDLMIRAAWMYYDEEMTHQQIAEKLRLSRVKVTRLLKKAREMGIVEIKVTRPLPLQYELSHQLETLFNLKDALIVNTAQDPETTLNEIGRASVEHLAQVMTPRATLGFGWSSTVSRMAKYLGLLNPMPDCRVVDLVGSVLGQNNPYSVSSKVADALDAPLVALPVPVVVKSREAREAILHEPNIREALTVASQSDIAFVGIGEAGPTTTLHTSGYLDESELHDLQQQGIVGDVLMRFYDIQGCSVHTSLDDCVIGLDWNDMSRLSYVVVVAAGITKVEALVGILRSSISNSLITDMETATRVLDYAQRFPAQTD